MQLPMCHIHLKTVLQWEHKIEKQKMFIKCSLDYVSHLNVRLPDTKTENSYEYRVPALVWDSLADD